VAGDEAPGRVVRAARFTERVIRAMSSQTRPSPAERAAAAARDDATYLYDDRGAWVAYRRSNLIFDASTNATIGFVPYGDGNVAGVSGDYLCTIIGERLFRAAMPPWSNCGSAPSTGAGVPPLPVQTRLGTVNAPAGYGPFRLD
jgi:hypothetical protein